MYNFINGDDMYRGLQDEEYAIHDNINIIQKMTGLGKGIEAPELKSNNPFGPVPLK